MKLVYRLLLFLVPATFAEFAPGFRGVCVFTRDDSFSGGELSVSEVNANAFNKLTTTREFVANSKPVESALDFLKSIDDHCDISLKCQKSKKPAECKACECEKTSPFPSPKIQPTAPPTIPFVRSVPTTQTPRTAPSTKAPPTTKPPFEASSYIPPDTTTLSSVTRKIAPTASELTTKPAPTPKTPAPPTTAKPTTAPTKATTAVPTKPKFQASTYLPPASTEEPETVPPTKGNVRPTGVRGPQGGHVGSSGIGGGPRVNPATTEKPTVATNPPSKPTNPSPKPTNPPTKVTNPPSKPTPTPFKGPTYLPQETISTSTLPTTAGPTYSYKGNNAVFSRTTTKRYYSSNPYTTRKYTGSAFPRFPASTTKVYTTTATKKYDYENSAKGINYNA